MVAKTGYSLFVLKIVAGAGGMCFRVRIFCRECLLNCLFDIFLAGFFFFNMY